MKPFVQKSVPMICIQHVVRDLIGQLPKFDPLQEFANAKRLSFLCRGFHLRNQESGLAVIRPSTLFIDSLIEICMNRRTGRVFEKTDRFNSVKYASFIILFLQIYSEECTVFRVNLLILFIF